ncbi:MAG: tRNA guanosine(34) transglycosylase Tgt [Acidobacteria bacterium]|nr:tRNA guanosine(34) transglycosylase Tgt [Acidobacteriota bacterium]
MPTLQFTVTHHDAETKARTGVLQTAHGLIETPVFMPVGTQGTVKGLTQDILEQLGVRILLANTYHLYLRPGEAVIREVGGLHRLMSWKGAILTDSGGYQVFSLRDLRKVTDEGVEFRSHLDGSRHLLSPERAVEIQSALRPDIMMVLDECTEYPVSHAISQRAMERTLTWAVRSKEAWEQLCINDKDPATGSLFGIGQGGVSPELRRECAQRLTEIGFPGYALGGLSLGEPRTLTYELVGATTECLPKDQPRYVMGVGLPEELPHYVAQGIDMMDCVLPTRNGRNGMLFTSHGRLHIRQARFARDTRPPDESCGCPTCRRYTRAYLRHLFVSGEMLGAILNSCHNLFFYLDTMRNIRQTIAAGNFSCFLKGFSDRVQGEVS